MMTRTEKWKNKRDVLRRESLNYLRILKDIHKICSNNTNCDNCQFVTPDDCEFYIIPCTWEIK